MRTNYTSPLDLTIQTVRNPKERWLRVIYYVERKQSEGHQRQQKSFENSMNVTRHCLKLMKNRGHANKPVQNTGHFWNLKNYWNIWSYLKRPSRWQMYEVVPVSIAKNVGAWMDSHLKLDTHITKTCSAAYHHLHNIQRIWKYITYKSTRNLAHAVVIRRIDYLYHEFGFSEEEIPIPFEVPWWVAVNSTFLQVKDIRRQNFFHGHTHIIE